MDDDGPVYHVAAPLRTAEEKVAARRRVDYVFEKLDQYPEYVSKWFNAPWYSNLRSDANFYSFLNHKGLPKEFTESWAAYTELKALLTDMCNANPESPLKLLLEAADPNRVGDVVIVDMCSGKGFLSVLLNFEFPNSKIIMIDNNTKAKIDHINSMPRVDFWLTDITTKKFLPQFKERISQAKAVVLVGIHLCGELSELFINAFHEIENIQCMILCPCCISKKRQDVLQKAKDLQISNYQLWCEVLTESINVGQKQLKRIEACSSEKNNFIQASK